MVTLTSWIAVGREVERLDVTLLAHLGIDRERHRHGVAVLGDLRRLDGELALLRGTIGEFGRKPAEPVAGLGRTPRRIARRHHARDRRQAVAQRRAATEALSRGHHQRFLLKQDLPRPAAISKCPSC